MNARPSIQPLLPRSEWSSHRNYPGQVLLFNAHQGFRRQSRDLIDAAESDGDHGRVGLHFTAWMGRMHSHERYEERKLYPYLERRHGLDPAPLQEGHEALHAAQARVREAVLGNDRRALVAALREHDRVLDEHLRLEEDMVIPRLLEMERAEFARYIDSSIDELLAEPGSAPPSGGPATL